MVIIQREKMTVEKENYMSWMGKMWTQENKPQDRHHEKTGFHNSEGPREGLTVRTQQPCGSHSLGPH